MGSPQGSSISPLLAILSLHYTFDVWMSRTFPGSRFERYCDDIVVHAESEQEAHALLVAISARLAECGLTVNQEKTRIVYCQDDRRGGSHEHTQFGFLGYTFRARSCRNPHRRGSFLGYNPAISEDARKRIGQELRRWQLHRHSDHSLTDLANGINAQVRGWISYYGRSFPTVLYPVLDRINGYLVRWAQRTYKRLQGHRQRAWRFLVTVAAREPNLFAHWQHGVRPRAG
jgi:RNA-directed DNA polymerase